MKNMIAVALMMATVAVSAQTDTIRTDPVTMDNEADSLSYFLGLSIGYDFQSLPFEADPDLILMGLSGSLKGTSNFDQQATKEIFMQLQRSLQQKEAEIANLAAQKSLEEGNQYLLENGKREDVITTESGLQYEVLVNGEGPMPADTAEVTVNYEGTLIDGTVFDSSYDRGEPVSFPLNRVINGWTEGVQLMPVGSTFKFYIPAELGYGSRAQGPIPANSVLIFKIELLEIK